MIKDVMPHFFLITGLDGRRWEIMESDEGEFVLTGKKAVRNGIPAYRRLSLPTSTEQATFKVGFDNRRQRVA